MYEYFWVLIRTPGGKSTPSNVQVENTNGIDPISNSGESGSIIITRDIIAASGMLYSILCNKRANFSGAV